MSEIKKVKNKERAVNSLWYNPRSGLIMIGMIMKFRLRQNLVKKKKKIHYLLSKIREDKRYFVKFEIYAPGSVLIKARNRNHESCPSSVVERTGAERFHANLKKRQEVRDFICYFLGESSFAPSRLACML